MRMQQAFSTQNLIGTATSSGGDALVNSMKTSVKFGQQKGKLTTIPL